LDKTKDCFGTERNVLKKADQKLWVMLTRRDDGELKLHSQLNKQRVSGQSWSVRRGGPALYYVYPVILTP